MATRSEAECVVDTIVDVAEEGHTAMYGDEQRQFAGWLGVPWALIALGLGGVRPDAIDELVAWWPRKGAVA